MVGGHGCAYLVCALYSPQHLLPGVADEVEAEALALLLGRALLQQLVEVGLAQLHEHEHHARARVDQGVAELDDARVALEPLQQRDLVGEGLERAVVARLHAHPLEREDLQASRAGSGKGFRLGAWMRACRPVGGWGGGLGLPVRCWRGRGRPCCCPRGPAHRGGGSRCR